MITSDDITRQVTSAVEANGPALAQGIDVDGIVAEVIQTYGLVSIDDIDHDEFWALVQRYDATQAVWVTTSAPFGPDGWQVVERESAAQVGVDLGNVELSAADLGCEPGTVCKVALLDDEDHEIRSVEVEAR